MVSAYDVPKKVAKQRNKMQGQSVDVYLRIRPDLASEHEKNSRETCSSSVFGILSDKAVNFRYAPLPPSAVNEPGNYMKNLSKTNQQPTEHQFTFTRVFDKEASQQDVFESAVSPKVELFLRGNNSLFFAYGVTGSGKTHTLVGSKQQPGILIRSLNQIFSSVRICNFSDTCDILYLPTKFNSVRTLSKDVESESLLFYKSKLLKMAGKIVDSPLVDPEDLVIEKGQQPESNDSGCSYMLFISIIEIYNEVMYDLLASDIKKLSTNPNNIRKRKQLNFATEKNVTYIKDATVIPVFDINEALSIIKVGCYNRSMAATHLNMCSSRSHVVYSLKLVKMESSEKLSTLPDVTCTDLTFIDLAGSERQPKNLSSVSSTTNNNQNDDRLKEASSINCSLLFLKNCLVNLKNKTLNKKSSDHFSMRQCKLTMLLGPFLLNKVNSDVVLLATVSDENEKIIDTVNTLRFSSLTVEAHESVVLKKKLESNKIDKNENLHEHFNQQMQQILDLFDESSDDSDTENNNHNGADNIFEKVLRKVQSLIDVNQNMANEFEVQEELIRGECYNNANEIINKFTSKYEVNLSNRENNLSEFYGNKISMLEDYYKNLLEEQGDRLFDSSNYAIANYSKLLNEVKHKSEELDRIKEEYAEKLVQSQHHNDFNVSANVESVLKNSFEQSNANLFKLKEEVIELKDQIKEMKNVTNSLESEVKIYREKLAKLEEENEHLRADLIKTEKEMAENEENAVNVKDEMIKLVGELKDKEEQVNNLKTEYMNKIEALTDKLDDAHRQIKTVERRSKHYQDRFFSVNDTIKAKDEQVLEARVKLDKYKTKLNEVVKHDKQRQSDMDALKKEHEQLLKLKNGMIQEALANDPQLLAAHIDKVPESFRVLYDNTRSYAMMLEERVSELSRNLSCDQLNLTSSVNVNVRSNDTPLTRTASVRLPKQQTKEYTPSVSSVSSSVVQQANPSMVFRNTMGLSPARSASVRSKIKVPECMNRLNLNSDKEVDDAKKQNRIDELKRELNLK